MSRYIHSYVHKSLYELHIINTYHKYSLREIKTSFFFFNEFNRLYVLAEDGEKERKKFAQSTVLKVVHKPFSALGYLLKF